VITAVLFGLVPALRATRGGRTPGGRVLAKALVAGQIALSLMLLVGAGLFLATLRNLLTLDLGFNRENILLVNSDLRSTMQAPDKARAHHDLEARLNAIPGVVSASSSILTPIGRSGWNGMSYPEGFVPQSRRDGMVFFNRISPGYFRTLRAPLLAGREFRGA